MTLFAMAAGSFLVPSSAQADIFEDVGVTGGDNYAIIKEVSGPASVTFHASAYTGGKPAITGFVGPSAKTEVTCRRSGYRVSRIGGQSFPRKRAVEEDVVSASIADQKASLSALDAACKAKRTTVQLPVTVYGACGKKTSGIVIGPSKISFHAPKQMATFTVTCAD